LLLAFVLAGLVVTPACVSTVHLGNVGTPPGPYYLTVSGIDANGLTQAGSPVAVTVIVTQ
jgi:ABC-type transporter Mla subunit MlaD